jgi:hypothetical protein
MNTGNGHFNLLARVLHWSMALMIIAMLFVGVTMVACCGCTTDCAIAHLRCRRTFRHGRYWRRRPRTGCCTR